MACAPRCLLLSASPSKRIRWFGIGDGDGNGAGGSSKRQKVMTCTFRLHGSMARARSIIDNARRHRAYAGALHLSEYEEDVSSLTDREVKHLRRHRSLRRRRPPSKRRKVDNGYDRGYSTACYYQATHLKSSIPHLKPTLEKNAYRFNPMLNPIAYSRCRRNKCSTKNGVPG